MSTLAQVTTCCLHQDITWTKNYKSSVRSRDIYLKAISKKILKESILDMSWKITNFRLQPRLPEAPFTNMV